MNAIKVPILMYHRVVPNILDPSIECYAIMNIVVSHQRFEKQMQYVKKHFTVITLRDLALFISEKEPIPENSCVVTFDDNFKDHYRYAFPILKKYHIPATFFIEGNHIAGNGQTKYLDRFYYMLDNTSVEKFDLTVSAKIGMQPEAVDLKAFPVNTFTKTYLMQASSLKRVLKQSDSATQNAILDELEHVLKVKVDTESFNNSFYLSQGEMTEMADQGMELAAHTMNHLSLSQVNLETARQEIFQSGDFIKALTGKKTIAFAYPFGEGYDSEEIISLLKEYGFYAACNVKVGLNTEHTDVLNLYRIGVMDYSIAES